MRLGEASTTPSSVWGWSGLVSLPGSPRSPPERPWPLVEARCPCARLLQAPSRHLGPAASPRRPCRLVPPARYMSLSPSFRPHQRSPEVRLLACAFPPGSSRGRGGEEQFSGAGPCSGIMADSATKYVMGKNGQRRMKDVELCLPICAGTVSFWQGKKVRNELRNGAGQGDPPNCSEGGGPGRQRERVRRIGDRGTRNQPPQLLTRPPCNPLHSPRTRPGRRVQRAQVDGIRSQSRE